MFVFFLWWKTFMKLNDYKNSFHVLALTDSQPQQNHKKSENIRTAALFDKCFFFRLQRDVFQLESKSVKIPLLHLDAVVVCIKTVEKREIQSE